MKLGLKFKHLKLCYVLLLFLIIKSCNQKEEELFVINPLKFSKDNFNLSMIADDITYIPLDNFIPIGSIYSMRINTKGIFISTNNPGLLHFDSCGTFIRVIARKGRGPSEYRLGHKFAVDEKNKKVYVVDDDKVKVYSLNGNFIRDISTRMFKTGAAEHIEIFNSSSLFLADYGTYGEFKFNWIFLDTLGNLISKKSSTVHPSGFMQRGSTYIFDNKLFYYNCLNDTIFSILPDLTFQPAYLFAKGDFRWPDNLEINSISPERYSIFFKPGSMLETKQFIFLKYSFRDRWAILLIDKKKQKTYQGYREGKRGIVNYVPSILNDLDGGLPSTPEPIYYCYYVNNDIEYIVTLINSFELKDHISSNEFRSLQPKYPEKKKELEQLANSLVENDNPILMLVKLKE
jgi:hypothetical protein